MIGMAKVLLVQPHQDGRQIKGKKNFYLPLSLVYIGTAVEDKHEVIVFDRNIDDRDFETFINEFKPDIVGFPTWTSTLLIDVIYLSKLIKRINSNIVIACGGVHATVEPESLMAEPYIDYVVKGEGEEAFLELCDKLEEHGNNTEILSKILNINDNPVRPFLDINSLKTPNYDLVEVSKYNWIAVNLSRGCPGDCTFCYNAPMWGINKPGSEKITENNPFVRVLKTEKMIEIFKVIIEKHGVKNFSIVDDNFVFFKKRVIEVCKHLERYKDLSFICESRADTINDEVCVALKKAGCHYVQIGIETGSQRMLNFLNKETTVKQNLEAIRCLQRNGLFVDCSMMIGMPTETVEDLKMTIDFLKVAKPEHPNVKIYVLQPSQLFDYCVEQGWIDKPKTLEGWSKWIGSMRWLGHNCSEIPDEVLVDTIRKLWSQRLYRRKLLAAQYWLKKGDIKHIVTGFKRLIYVRGHIKLPFMRMIKIQKQ